MPPKLIGFTALSGVNPREVIYSKAHALFCAQEKNTLSSNDKPNDKPSDKSSPQKDLLSEVERGIVLEKARLNLETRTEGGMRVYLISVELSEDDPNTVQEDLQELGALVRSLGDECIGAAVQKRTKIGAHSLIGTGKAEEIKRSCHELKIDYVVCDKIFRHLKCAILKKLSSFQSSIELA